MPNGKKATKKAAAKEKLVEQDAPVLADRLETWGYRAYCETLEHWPCSTLLAPDIPTCRYWAHARMQGEHSECTFKIERILFDKTTFHVLSAAGEIPDDPFHGPIEWSKSEPLDLGPIWEHLSIEGVRAIKGLPEAAIQSAEAALAARPPISLEAPEAEIEEEGEAPKAKNGDPEDAPPIGQSHPAPKPENVASHRPSGHRALKVSNAKPRRALKANGKSKSKKRV